jgi:hypothetical protein
MTSMILTYLASNLSLTPPGNLTQLRRISESERRFMPRICWYLKEYDDCHFDKLFIAGIPIYHMCFTVHGN